MNPFERIKEMKDVIKTEIANNNQESFTAKEHYNRMINMLNIIEVELENAEYNYEVESAHGKITTFSEFIVTQKNLNENVIIFQPIAVDDAELSNIDMQSLADILKTLRDNGEIKENILLLPPNINVFRAVLAQPQDNDGE